MELVADHVLERCNCHSERHGIARPRLQQLGWVVLASQLAAIFTFSLRIFHDLFTFVLPLL